MNPNETKGFGQEEPEFTDHTCPTCGMDQRDWSQNEGYQERGESYCCQGCAEGTGCTCREESESEKPGTKFNPRKKKVA